MAKIPTAWVTNPNYATNEYLYDSATITYDSAVLNYDGITVNQSPITINPPTVWTPA